jgi:hypothetical protein
MTELRYLWQQPLLDAQTEPDVEKLTSKVETAETAIFLRLSALSKSGDGQQELEALNQAAQDLLRIKTERLGWPPVELNGPSRAN